MALGDELGQLSEKGKQAINTQQPQTASQRAVYKTLNQLMSAVIDEDHEGGPTFRPGREDEGEAARRLLTIFRQFFEESGNCANVRANFAATVMACSALEALLMLACIANKDSVVTSKGWHKHAKKKKTFVDNLTHFDLSELTEIGLELRWFHAKGLPLAISEAYPNLDLSTLNTEFADGIGPLLIAPILARSIRNHLHPGRSLRDKVEVDEDSKKVGVFVSLISVLGFLEGRAGSELE